jgi:hypothetical protein
MRSQIVVCRAARTRAEGDARGLDLRGEGVCGFGDFGFCW